MTTGRQATLQVHYNGKNISKDLQQHLTSWTFTDNLSGQADDLQITLEDRGRLWIGGWMPEVGATLQATIVRTNWTKDGKTDKLPIGLFEIDEVDVSGPPSSATVKGTSVPQSSTLRGQRKNRAWEKTKLSQVVKDVAKRVGLKCFYDTHDDPLYDRIEQTEETDLEFLARLCNDEGLCLKISNGQIVILDEAKYEAKAPVATIDRSTVQVINWQGTHSLSGTYKACHVEYHDPSTNKTISYTFTPPKPPKTDRILVVNDQVSSIAQAERLAKKRLRDANKTGTTMNITIPGDIRFLAGYTVTLKGWGYFDGKYICTQVVHSQQSGYQTMLQLRKCLEGY